jgi:hypothetical protein
VALTIPTQSSLDVADRSKLTEPPSVFTHRCRAFVPSITTESPIFLAVQLVAGSDMFSIAAARHSARRVDLATAISTAQPTELVVVSLSLFLRHTFGGPGSTGLGCTTARNLESAVAGLVDHCVAVIVDAITTAGRPAATLDRAQVRAPVAAASCSARCFAEQ